MVDRDLAAVRTQLVALEGGSAFARLTGWRVDIKSESQLAQEEAGVEWAEGEWLVNDAGEYVWHTADGEEVSAADAGYETATRPTDGAVARAAVAEVPLVSDGTGE